jgi:hypothetical protein
LRCEVKQIDCPDLLVHLKQPDCPEPNRKVNLGIFVIAANKYIEFPITGFFIAALKVFAIFQPIDLFAPTMRAYWLAIPKLFLQVRKASLFIGKVS